jgi:hypothetical protein
MADKPESKVVDARNQNRVLFHGNEDDARDFIETNFPRHHVDPAAPVMEFVEPDVVLTGPGGQEMYLGPESGGGWQKYPPVADKTSDAKSTGGKV